MKKIEAVVPQKTVSSIRAELAKAFKADVERSKGYPAMTFADVDGKGLGHTHPLVWGGQEFTIDIFPKTKLEIIILAADMEKVIGAIIEGVRACNLDNKHQGKIFVFDIEEAIRVRDGKRGEEVIK